MPLYTKLSPILDAVYSGLKDWQRDDAFHDCMVMQKMVVEEIKDGSPEELQRVFGTTVAPLTNIRRAQILLTQYA